MPEIYEIKNRIEGLKSIHNITYAMQIVTISRLKRIIANLARVKDAHKEVMNAVMILIAEKEKYYQALVNPNLDKEGTPLFVLFFSNRGFCGSYNQDVLSQFNGYCEANAIDPEKVDLLCVGKKGQQSLKKPPSSRIRYFEPEKDILSADEIVDLYRKVKAVKEQNRPIYLVYFQFKSIVTQRPTVDSFYPLKLDGIPSFEKLNRSVPHFVEPDEATAFTQLVESHYFLKLSQTVRDASSSEFSQRFLLMKSAVENVKELSDELYVDLNKQRQGLITQEVSEIISTFKALNKKR